MTSERRRFSNRERFALFLASDGRCSKCGKPMGRSFHADHVVPFSKGGLTDVTNGQALCATCNLKKGATMINSFQLRDWQRRSIAKYHNSPKADFLQVATPAAGKTTFSLTIAQMLMGAGIVQRVVIVVPTNYLRRQWRQAGIPLGLQLSATFSNKDYTVASDYDGFVATYQSVASLPELFRRLCTEHPTLVILDEIHHAGDQQGWGEAIKRAFAPSAKRLAITGTPFRSKGERIPFVEYNPQGKLIADDTYSYGEALRDGVCREVYFHTFEGEFAWQQLAPGVSTTHSATFADDLDASEESARLKTALSTEADWLPNVIRDADRRLKSIRENEFPDAAGLIIAMNKGHALRIAALVRKHTGQEPFVAISENPDNEEERPSEIIDRFANGDKDTTGDVYRAIPRWLVAVKMVSEGVDIPRLCVGVYASNVTSEIFFRQAVGRFVRVIPEAPGVSAALFVPKDARLVAHMERIREEVEVFVEEEEEREITERARREQDRDITYEAISASARPDSIIIGDEVFTPEEIAEVRSFMIATGMEGMALELGLKFYRKAVQHVMATYKGVITTTPVAEAVQRATRSLDEERDVLRKRITKGVNRLVHRSGMEHGDIHAELNRRTGVRQMHSSKEQLEERLRLVQSWEQEAMANDR